MCVSVCAGHIGMAHEDDDDSNSNNAVHQCIHVVYILLTIHSDVKAEHIKHTFYIFNCSSVFELELYFLRTFISPRNRVSALFRFGSRISTRKMFASLSCVRLPYLLVLIRLFFLML